MEKVDEKGFAGLVFENYDIEEIHQNLLLVWRDDEVVWTETLYLGWFGGRAPFGEDLDGNGKPNIVVQYVGGSICCTDYMVLEFTETVREVGHLSGSIVEFRNLDDDPDVEVISRSPGRFEDWLGPGGPWESIRIVEKYDPERNGWYTNFDVMRLPPMSAEALIAAANEVRADPGWAPFPPQWNSDLWGVMLDLIFPATWTKPANLRRWLGHQKFLTRRAFVHVLIRPFAKRMRGM